MRNSKQKCCLPVQERQVQRETRKGDAEAAPAKRCALLFEYRFSNPRRQGLKYQSRVDAAWLVLKAFKRLNHFLVRLIQNQVDLASVPVVSHILS